MIDSARDAMVVKSWVFSLSLLKTSYKANELMYEQLYTDDCAFIKIQYGTPQIHHKQVCWGKEK